ncbi:MAG TPA: DUF4129 domain-containing protein [Candidatus Limnocylindrales bacterium]|nr:DUF4129 domain-containing protein [Candidatus Limnocylindrales bacterium]
MSDVGTSRAPIGSPRTDPVTRAIGLLPPSLAALAEGAWVAVVGALLAAGSHDDAHVGVVGFAVAALAGLAAGRRFGDRAAWPMLVVVLTATAAVVGWLASPEVRTAVLSLDPPEAVAHHSAGWLAGIAFLRGSAHARPISSEGAMETLLAVALPGLAVPILIGGALPEPWRGRFLDDARLEIVVFLVSATAGLGVTRLSALRGAAGFDWRGNRAWLLLLVVLVLGVSLVALPIATVVGPAVQVAVAVLFLPLILVGTVAGLRQLSKWAIVGFLGAYVLLVVALEVVREHPLPLTPEPNDVAGSGASSPDATFGYVVFVLVAIALIALGVAALARLWSRDVIARRGGDVPEERWIDATSLDGGTAERRPRRRRPAARTPASAEQAYLALLDDLERLPEGAERRRRHAESPAAHAARLRRSAAGAVALDLLAADYELARFGGVELAPGESRRAVARWQRLRKAFASDR